MCVVSMVGDHFNEHWDYWKKRFSQLDPNKTAPFDPNIVPQPYISPITSPIGNPNPSPVVPSTILIGVPQEEFDKLKAEVEHMKKLLIKAKLYDEANNEPNCEMEEKVAFLKKIAEAVGVNLDEVFGSKSNLIGPNEQGGI